MQIVVLSRANSKSYGRNANGISVMIVIYYHYETITIFHITKFTTNVMMCGKRNFFSRFVAGQGLLYNTSRNSKFSSSF